MPPMVELPLADRPADVGHQPLEESNIMHGKQHRTKHLAREKKVPDRPTAEMPAGVAVAAVLYRIVVGRETTISQPHRA